MMTHRCCVALVGIALLAPGPALAEEPVETAIRGMVMALDTTPEWSASYRALRYDAASDTATLSGFTARTVRPGTEIAVETIVVTGYAERPDGAFTATSIRAAGGSMRSGFVQVAIDDLGFEDVLVPVLEPLVFNPRRPFTSIVKIYGEAAKASFARARAHSVQVVQTIDRTESLIVYEQLRIDGFADGKVARVQAGPIRLDSPTPDGLVTMAIGRLEASDMDLAAFLHVYDPDAYRDGAGDMIWRNGVAHVAYRDIDVEVPGARIAMRGVIGENLRVRQPPGPFAAFIDEVMLNPNLPEKRMEVLAKRYLPSLFGAWSLGKMEILGVEISPLGIDRMAFDAMTIRDFSIDGLGEFSIEGIEALVRGQFAMKLGRFAIGDMPFGGIDGLNRLITTIDLGREPEPADVVPTIGFIDMARLEVQTPDIERLGVERFRINARDYVGVAPTSGTLELVGLVIPTNAITDVETRGMLTRFGYDRIDFNVFMETEWRAADETLVVKDLTFRLARMGSLAMKFALSGYPLTAFSDEAVLVAALPNLKLVEAEVTFRDESIVGAALVMMVEQFGFSLPIDQFRKQFAGAIPLLLSFATASDPQLAALVRQSGLLAQLTPAVSDLVAAEGGSITFLLAPPSPVPVVSIGEIAASAPQDLAALLGLSITGTPGEPPAPEPAPAPAPNTVPERSGGTAAPGSPQ